MNVDFERCGLEIKEARERVEVLVAGLTPEQLTRQPEPGKWSIAECILHLNVSAAVVQPLMEKAIAQGKRDNKVGSGPFNVGPKGRLLVWLAEPPPKFRMRAPRVIRLPERIDDPLKIVPDFIKAQDGWERLIRESAGLNLAKIKVGPLLSPLRQRLAATFPWMMAHQSRHLLQAENAKRQILPAAPTATARAV